MISSCFLQKSKKVVISWFHCVRWRRQWNQHQIRSLCSKFFSLIFGLWAIVFSNFVCLVVMGFFIKEFVKIQNPSFLTPSPLQWTNMDILHTIYTEKKEIGLLLKLSLSVNTYFWQFFFQEMNYEKETAPKDGNKLTEECQTTPMWVTYMPKWWVETDNGGNDSHKRQSQLWDQITCHTKTG